MPKTIVSRRTLLKGGAIAAAAACAMIAPAALLVPKASAARVSASQKTPVIGSKNVTGMKTAGSRAKVYFTPVLDSAHLIKLYQLVNSAIYGKVAIKLHTGEKNGPNILPRDMGCS